MDQLIPSLAALLEPFRDCFRIEVFRTFQILIAGWIVCVGPHTISEVWQATGLAAKRHHDTAYAVFHSAAWEWDYLGMVLATLVMTHLIPGGVVWLVVDDTLCHKRGAKVAFGGIFLDAVLSSKRHKTLRFGLNGSSWYRCPLAVSQGSLLLHADVVAALSQEGDPRASEPPLGGRRAGPQVGRGESPADLLAGGRLRLRQLGDLARSA